MSLPGDARYAVYFAPEDDSALARFGEAWLARPEAGEGPPHYGFHATLKAPFRLADGYATRDLVSALDSFARRVAPFVGPCLRLDALDGFLALRPAQPSPSLDGLAERCLRSFDCFRAPPTAAELARRLEAPLDERERELLARWGYPYVLERYRFHLTLTDRLDSRGQLATRLLLAPLTAPLEREPLAVRSVCLFVQAAPGEPFALRQRFALAG
ncbi:MAG TPA: DUF1045 domain-containing protein [Rhodocyclaceae bacterium]